MVNTIDQWVEESTRYSGEEEPSMLDQVFTKKPEPPPSIQYFSPMGRSDHVTLVLEIQEEDGTRYREDYKKERLNYARADSEKLRESFADIERRNIINRRALHEKYEIFLHKNNEGVKKYAPIYRVRKNIHTWYNAICTEAKKVKEKAWKKLKKAEK
ncbi:hypothetical protein E2C01_084111 [Portunus trituberculatus]|uniref:Endonuclease/exonuclease/phosphatase domain-containing protein n=1 Tax=Portunus trituberculatus TaxID=210409 RepID=A0A5B7J5F7_PORTR|nr:hypothetical protein [Portunus trituberculatus]